MPRRALPSEAGALAGKTVAITGANGFLGSRLVDRLAAVPCQIVRVPRQPAWDSVVIDADVVFHFAAQTSATVAAEDPDADRAANVAPLRALLDACRRTKRRPLVLFAGSVTQSGIPLRLPVDEDAPDQPVTVYDRHKLMAEHDLKSAAADGTVDGATLRLSNVYGPGTHGSTNDRNVLNRMIATALRGEPLTVYGAGGQVRDYVFVEDVIDAFLAAAARPAAVNGRHFVIGSGQGITIREAFELVAARVESMTGTRVPVITTEPPAALSAIEQRHCVADPSRFSAATGWHAARTLSDGIDRTIEACLCG